MLVLTAAADRHGWILAWQARRARFAGPRLAAVGLDLYRLPDRDSNSDVDWQVGSMPYGWNDRVSSFKSFGQCATRIWENNNFTGASYGYIVNSSYVGAAMNDRASSIQWN